MPVASINLSWTGWLCSVYTAFFSIHLITVAPLSITLRSPLQLVLRLCCATFVVALWIHGARLLSLASFMPPRSSTNQMTLSVSISSSLLGLSLAHMDHNRIRVRAVTLGKQPVNPLLSSEVFFHISLRLYTLEPLSSYNCSCCWSSSCGLAFSVSFLMLVMSGDRFFFFRFLASYLNYLKEKCSHRFAKVIK